MLEEGKADDEMEQRRTGDDSDGMGGIGGRRFSISSASPHDEREGTRYAGSVRLLAYSLAHSLTLVPLHSLPLVPTSGSPLPSSPPLRTLFAESLPPSPPPLPLPIPLPLRSYTAVVNDEVPAFISFPNSFSPLRGICRHFPKEAQICLRNKCGFSDHYHYIAHPTNDFH